jgi:undecaprenyl diphosphate synthase
MSSSKDKINKDNIPQHVAVIMDGNGRWAKQRGKKRTFGHENGVQSVRNTVEAAAEIGIKYLTLYAFSTENWNRPQEEVDTLMSLLIHYINEETKTLNKNKIKLQAIGDLKSLPVDCYKELQDAIENTKNNSHMTLVVALSYSSQWEIINAVKEIAKKVEQKQINANDITIDTFNQHLCTYNIPNPELMIRTSGEHRISNFLLWQLSYSELYFTDILWPDFSKEDFFDAIIDYQNRERRFGKISEQLTS